jgi:hypothetical protein
MDDGLPEIVKKSFKEGSSLSRCDEKIDLRGIKICSAVMVGLQ